MPETKYKVPPNWISIVFIALMVAMLYFLYVTPQQGIQKSYEIPYSQFKQLLSQGRVQELELRGHLASGTLVDFVALGPTRTMGKNHYQQLQ